MLQWRKKRGRHGIGGGTGERSWTLIYSIKVLEFTNCQLLKGTTSPLYIYDISGWMHMKNHQSIVQHLDQYLMYRSPKLVKKKNETMNRRNAPSLLLSASIYSHSYRGWEQIRVRVWLYDLFGGSGENGFGFYWPNWVSLDCYYY